MANLKLTRDQLATFLKNQEQIKAFEALFTVADVSSPDTIQTIQNTIDTANASANSALAQVQYLIDTDGQTVQMAVKNATPTVIPKGTTVGFAGVDSSNRITVSPYLADGSADTLYFVGCATKDIPGSSLGLVTLYGRITGVNTSGIPSGESWSAGNILWASPNIAGLMTKTKPTAPDNVVSVAAVLFASVTAGQIMVRPTISLQEYYGEFTKTSTQTPAVAGDEYLVTWDVTDISNGVFIGSPSSRIVVPVSGLYQVSADLQITCSVGAQRDVVAYFKKNGADVANSAYYQSIDINNGYTQITLSEFFSLNANDYIEVGFGVLGGLNISLAPIAATANFPASPSAHLSILQVQQ
jgi:hypothetical protein